MRIPQYIYTRLSAAESPQGQTGFQSAFVDAERYAYRSPVGLEAHIHYPQVTGFVEKRVVCFEEVDHAAWMVLLFMRNLPEARDEFGRAGLFLCQGFLIPPAVWQCYRNPLRLAAGLEQYRFETIPEVLASPLVDRAKGTIAPIELAVLPPEDERPAPPRNPAERAALQLLYRIAAQTADDSALVYKGWPSLAEEFFGRMAAFLPSALKARLAWDSAFDGGKLFFSPFRVVAYSEVPPVTGRQAVYDPSQTRLHYADDAQEALTHPADPFARWLASNLERQIDQEEIDHLYAASLAFQQGLPYPGGALPAPYVRANLNEIRDWLRKGTDPLLPKAWRTVIAETLPDQEFTQLATEGFTDLALANATAATILHGKLYPGNFKDPPMPKLVQCPEPRLRALATMWTKAPFPKTALYDIVIEERERILWLLATNGMEEEAALELGFLPEEVETAKEAFPRGLKRAFKRLFGKKG